MNEDTNGSTATAEAGAEIDIMQLAREADAAAERGETPVEGQAATATAQQTGKAAEQASAKKDGQQAGQQQQGQQGKDGDKGGKKGEQAGAEAQGSESDFTKAQKDKGRRDDSWKALNAEKETFRQEKAALASELQGLRREVSEMRKARTSGPAKDPHGLSASDYDRMAKGYADKGDERMATAAREKADALRQAAQGGGQSSQAGSDFASPEFQSEWQRNTRELIEKDPELGKPDNPVVIMANNLINHEVYGQFLRANPAGIKMAVEVANLMKGNAAGTKAAEELKAAQEEIKGHKAEVERLNALLQPRGGPPGGLPKGEKKLEDMTDAEADAHVRRIAEAADRGEST